MGFEIESQGTKILPESFPPDKNSKMISRTFYCSKLFEPRVYVYAVKINFERRNQRLTDEKKEK